MQCSSIGYTDGDLAFEGHLALPERDDDELVPLVLVAHAWGGRDAFADERAEDLARLGYAGFALDVYGAGVRGTTPDENARLMQPLVDDRALLQRRLRAGLDAARALKGVDGARVAAIGYCFGGLCVLDFARSGADVRGVVAYHGLLDGADFADASTRTVRALILHGHDDPFAPPKAVDAFKREMSRHGIDWELHVYGGAAHAFTNPAANDPARGIMHHPRVASRAWDAMRHFLAELF